MGYLEANSYFFKEFLNVGAREPVWLSWLSLCLFLFFLCLLISAHILPSVSVSLLLSEKKKFLNVAPHCKLNLGLIKGSIGE